MTEFRAHQAEFTISPRQMPGMPHGQYSTGSEQGSDVVTHATKEHRRPTLSIFN